MFLFAPIAIRSRWLYLFLYECVCFPVSSRAHAFGVRRCCVVVYSGALRAPLYTTTQHLAGGCAARELGKRCPSWRETDAHSKSKTIILLVICGSMQQRLE